MGNFGFLKDDYNELYLLCSDTEKYLKIDSTVSMLKARQAIEWIVAYLGCSENDLFININNLEERSHASPNIIDKFHLIRKNANRSVHNNKGVDHDAVLDSLREICVWLVLSHDRKKYGIIKFSEDEKGFVRKYSNYDKTTSYTAISKANAFNPLEVVGTFDEDSDEEDPLRQDVFETTEEYYKRIKYLPAIKIGYAFLEESQVDELSGIAFPLFHINKNSKIQSVPIVALIILAQNRIYSIDGHIKAKLTVHDKKVYYDYNSLTLEDDIGNVVKLSVVSWERFGYESERDFWIRIKELPNLPVAVARPLRKEYVLEKQILPFAIKPMAYAANIFTMQKINCSLDRDSAKKACSIKTNFIVYSRFTENYKPKNVIFYNKTDNETMIFGIEGTVRKRPYAQNSYMTAVHLYNEGWRFEKGVGVPMDIKRAKDLYRQAAEMGHKEASSRLRYLECQN